jgi:putative amidase-like protein
MPSTNPAVAHFSRIGAVEWANNHVYSKSYFSEDCTDFVSQAWNRGGGLSQEKPWWFFHEELLGFSWLGHTYSKNWAAAEDFAEEMAAHKWVERTNVTNLSVKIIPDAEPGDVVLWHEPKQPTYWSHVALIIGTRAGATRIDQHSIPKYQTAWNKKWQKASSKLRNELRVQLLHVETG